MPYLLLPANRPLMLATEVRKLSTEDPLLPPSEPLEPELNPSGIEAMVLAHVPQVRLVARSLWERTRFAVELDDLVGYGMLGLLDAVRKFNPTRGVLLKTYAEHRIRGAILDGLRGMDWLSRSARRQARSVVEEPKREHALRVCGSAEFSLPGDAGMCAATPAAPARRIPPKLTALFCGGGVGEMERLSQHAGLPADWAHHQPTPERLLERKQERTALAAAIETLPERQRRVLDLYYRQELSMKQIAVLMGVHESRVSQIHLAAITRLRKTLHPRASKEALTMPALPARAAAAAAASLAPARTAMAG